MLRLSCQGFRGSAEALPFAAGQHQRVFAEDADVPDLCVPLVKAQV